MNDLTATTLAAHFPAVSPEIRRALENKKPLTAATVKGQKGKKRNCVSAWPVTILDTPAQLPAPGGRGSTAWPPRLRRSSTEPSAWAWKCNSSSSPSTSPPSPNRWRTWKTIWRCPHDRKEEAHAARTAFLLIETLAPYVVTGLSVTDLSTATGIPAPSVCRDMDSLAAEAWRKNSKAGAGRLRQGHSGPTGLTT